MALDSGTQLGHYEITDQIGKGGMGEVYRARDTKLGREVAIKVLPAEFARDAERLARLEREARMLAALNHPNIAAIHGLEESDDTRFLVLELVEGDTLADRLKRGAIPVEESLKLALQIAEALEAAHEKGVIHRDLKPANIKITPEGRIKVLDFGLAKAFIGDQADVNLSNSPTLSMAATQAGMILGTAAYMSPEQASGEVADHRADVWALGVVLFEMLTGRQLFTGKTASHVMGAVLNIEPDWERLPADLHPRVRVLLERLLEKEAKDRLSGISDARVEIQRVLADPAGVTAVPAAGAVGPQLHQKLAWVAAFVLGSVLAATAVWFLRPEPAVPLPVTRFDYDLADGQTFRNTGRPVFALSPDGRRFAFNTSEGIYLREMHELEARLIPGTQSNLTSPFFSPDGQWVGYWDTTSGQITKISISGGAPIPLTAATNPFGVSWEEDGTILYGQPEGIRRVSENGGEGELVIEARDGEQMNGPQLLPGGDSVLFTATTVQGEVRWDQAEILAESLASHDRVVLWRGGSDARYVTTGHLVYALGDNLFALPLDLDTMAVTGGAVSIAQGVLRSAIPGANTASANYGLSRDGSLAFVFGASDAAAARTLVWVDRAGNEQAIAATPRPYFSSRVSPDGRRIATEIREDNTDIWIHDLERGTQSRLTFDPGLDRFPVWTPDGSRIAYSSEQGGQAGQYEVYWKEAAGTGEEELIGTDPARRLDAWSWTPDGETLLINEGGADIGLVHIGGDGLREAVLEDPGFPEGTPEISPDGRWMAYRSGESGRVEIYVRPFPDVTSGSKWQVSINGGNYPGWSPDGTELFYRTLDGAALMGVTVETTDAVFSAGIPRIIVEGPYVFSPGNGRNWDIAPDGERFLFLKAVDGSGGEITSAPQINVILNWTQELLERVPVN